MLHQVCGSAAFLALIVFCIILARRQRAHGQPRMAACSLLAGVLCAAGVASGGLPHGTLTLFVGVSIALLWAAVIAVRLATAQKLTMTQDQHSAGTAQHNWEITMHTITSADGTPIAYDRTGAGPPLVLVGGAFSYRRYPGQVKLAGLLAAQFTVYSYDRRGRGDSGDTAPYTIQREIDDLAAVITAAGGRAHVWGLSSGAVLALDAAAAGVPIDRLAVQEPPLVVDPADRRPPVGLRQHVSDLVAAGQRGAAVRYYMTAGMGAPAFVPVLLRLMPKVWKQLTVVAHTLPYDTQLVEDYQAGRPLPPGLWAAVTVPVLVMCGTEQDTPPMMRHAAAAVAAAIPGSELMTRRGLGHTKTLNAKAIAATLTAFLTSPEGNPADPAPDDRSGTQPHPNGAHHD
jgi:pimeloyl-ACP methyl ester carboxylesterase